MKNEGSQNPFPEMTEFYKTNEKLLLLNLKSEHQVYVNLLEYWNKNIHDLNQKMGFLANSTVFMPYLRDYFMNNMKEELAKKSEIIALKYIQLGMLEEDQDPFDYVFIATTLAELSDSSLVQMA